MKNGYFHRVQAQTPTKFWINNPSRQETEWAIEAGAVGCTNNPSVCQKLIDHPDKEEGKYAMGIFDQVLREVDDDSEAHCEFQRRIIKHTVDRFRPMFDASDGVNGYVSIQGDPVNEDDPNVVIAEARKNKILGPNTCIKIPTTASGLKAMETLIPEDTPINATEVFGIAQAISLFDMYDKVSKESGKKPMFYISHIAGIYDDFLRNYVAENKVDISPDVLYQAGLAVARKLYLLMKERGYPGTLVGGGARGLHHFTEMVGGDAVVTINWRGTADKLIEQDPPVVSRIFNPVEQYVIDELMEKLPDFRRGYLEDGLTVEEYHHFGPVQLFRSSFLKSWHKVLDMMPERRKQL